MKQAMTEQQKIEFYAAVYECALGDPTLFWNMADCFNFGDEVAEIYNAAFKQAKEDLRDEEEHLRDQAEYKAKLYFERIDY